MFLSFFYLLRSKGIDVSVTEWLTLIEALDKGLCHGSFTEFYYLCRMCLVNRESDYDNFDLAFGEYFKGLQDEHEIPPEIRKWLDKGEKMDTSQLNQELYRFEQHRDANTVKRMFRERVTEQNSEHNGGNYWIGTSGGSAFGHSGRNPGRRNTGYAYSLFGYG